MAETASRRIDACLAACEGIPTETLEAGWLGKLLQAIRLYRAESFPCDRCVEDDCSAFGGECSCGCHKEAEFAEAALDKALMHFPIIKEDHRG